jgi:hypothetical protein
MDHNAFWNEEQTIALPTCFNKIFQDYNNLFLKSFYMVSLCLGVWISIWTNYIYIYFQVS